MEALPASVPALRPQHETNSDHSDCDNAKAEQEAEAEAGSASATPTQSPRDRKKGKDEDDEDEDKDEVKVVEAGEEAAEEEVRKEKWEHTTEDTEELLRACETRDKAAVFELTRRGVRADAQDPLDARTPLHAAVTAGSADLLVLLLSSCPDMLGGAKFVDE